MTPWNSEHLTLETLILQTVLLLVSQIRTHKKQTPHAAVWPAQELESALLFSYVIQTMVKRQVRSIFHWIQQPVKREVEHRATGVLSPRTSHRKTRQEDPGLVSQRSQVTVGGWHKEHDFLQPMTSLVWISLRDYIRVSRISAAICFLFNMVFQLWTPQLNLSAILTPKIEHKQHSGLEIILQTCTFCLKLDQTTRVHTWNSKYNHVSCGLNTLYF